MDLIIEKQSLDLNNSLTALHNSLHSSINKLAYTGVAFFILSIITILIIILRASRNENSLLETHLKTEKQTSKKFAHQASHDSLTGLWNRRYFEKTLFELKEKTNKQNIQHGLLYLDLDQFKIVNDTAGHEAGDQLIKQVSDIIQSHIRDSDTLARLGGDEFGVLLPNCNLDNSISVSEKIRNALDTYRFNWHEANFHIGSSIGIVMLNQNNIDKNVLKMADIACYNAKDSGRNCIHVYENDNDQVIKRENEMNVISQINNALTHHRMHLYAQPITPINTEHNNQEYYEILIRMEDEKGDIISPITFLPAAERYGLMPKIDSYVISSAFSWLKKPANKDIRLSINLSGTSINSKEFIRNFYTNFSQFEFAHNISFEITETSTLRDFSESLSFFENLKKLGYKIALDDFGSGLASFEYLKNLPIDTVKIDGSFIQSIESNDVDVAMVESIVNVCTKMNIQTVAEYVENEQILSILKTLNVDYAQGYAVSKPFPLDELTQWLQQNITTSENIIDFKKATEKR
ncbi:MAG: hypothetical protein COB62_06905 [Piscirickettsiaceae bacterium]|nr:MAG: hypothetical protein COB62_06905 [Piscirickettsiaceae bacterium]